MDFNKFFKKLEELDFINEEGRIQVSLKGVKDWPSNLDTENFEIDMISNGDDKDGEGYIAGWAGGDWQEATRFTIMIPSTKEKPYVIMFDDPCTCFAGKDIHKELKKLYKEYKGNSNLTESVFNKILHESTIISDKEFVELYKKRRDVTKKDQQKLNDYINNNTKETIFVGSTFKYSTTYYFKKVGNAYYEIDFNDYKHYGEYDPNFWGKKILKDGCVNIYGEHVRLHHIDLEKYNDPNTGMNGTLWS